MSRSAVATSTGAGKSAVGAIFVVGLALALLLIVRARPAPDPFDPRSSSSSGATALVELLERSGADVDITRVAPEQGANVRVLILDDRLNDEQRSATLDFVDAGGIAVVADPASSLHGGPDLDGGSIEVNGINLPRERVSVDREANVGRGACTIDALDGVRGVYVPDGVLFPVGPSEPACLTSGDNSFVIVRPIADGLVVGLGDNEPFVNEHLRRADNAALMTALVAPRQGGAVVILLGEQASQSVADVGTGDDTLIDLVPPWIWMALVLGGISFVVFAISRSVRVGQVLDEPLTTPRTGSELVSATGNLMQRAKHSTRAGWLLQIQLHRDLCREFHVDQSAPLADLDQLVSGRAGTPIGSVETLLRDQVSDEAALLQLSSRIDRLRKDVLT